MPERVVFHGRVQGVGFRAAAHRLSRGRAVTGYVRNLEDGTVELVAEGPESDVQQFIEAVRARAGGNILNIERSTIATTEAFAGFEIRH